MLLLGIPPGGEDIDIGRALEAEQEPCDLLVELEKEFSLLSEGHGACPPAPKL